MSTTIGSSPARGFRVRFAPAVLAVLSLLSGCAESPPDPETGPPQRVISLVPAVTEILFAIGAGDRVVGISDFDTYPPEALTRPRVGALLNPNVEMIFALAPDLVITYGTQSLLQERLAVGGIRQFPFVTGPTAHVLDSIRAIGRELGLEDDADRLANQIGDELDRLRASRPQDPPTVLLVHSRDLGSMGGFYSAGADSYLGELIEIAGGRNLFEDISQNAFQPSLEEVLDRGPEVIIELLPSDLGGPDALAARRRDWDALASVPAVQSGRVYILADDYLMLDGPRLDRVAQTLAGVIRTDKVSSRVP